MERQEENHEVNSLQDNQGAYCIVNIVCDLFFTAWNEASIREFSQNLHWVLLTTCKMVLRKLLFATDLFKHYSQ